MEQVTLRELSDNGGAVLQRVAAGEHLIVTQAGEPVAELRPLRRRGLTAEALLERWRELPPVDPVKWRKDIDDVIDSALHH